jgi:heterotetrameric sarcosine oxidase gamma subunit
MSQATVTIHLQELTGTTLLRLHSLQTLAELGQALAAGGLPLPAEVNQCLGQDPAVLCLAPGEWLVCSERLDFSSLSEPLRAVLETRLTAILDVSAGLSVLRLSGTGVPWLLNKLCSLDVQSGLERGPHCTRTRLQHAGAIVHCRKSTEPDADSVFDLIIDRSLLRYTRQVLLASIPHAEHLNQTYGNRS